MPPTASKKRPPNVINTDNLNPGAYAVWTSANNARVDPGVLRNALKKINPDLLAYIAEPPGAHQTLRRAIKKASTPIGFVWREIGADNKGELHFALIAEHRDVHAPKDYRANAIAICSARESDGALNTNPIDKGNQVIQCLDSLEKAYNRERGVLANQELWILVRDVCAKKNKGTRLAEGIYLLLSIDDVIDLNQAFEATSAGIRVVCLPILGGPGVREQLRPSVQAALMEELAGIRDKLEERHRKAIEKDRRIRRDGVDNDVRDALELRKKAVALRGILQIETEELDKGIELLTNEAHKLIEESWGNA